MKTKFKFPLEVSLTPEEVLYAATEGLKRTVESIMVLKKPVTHGALHTHSAWGRDIEGACGEYVLAKCLGYPWVGKGAIHAVDINDGKKGIEVRCTPWPEGNLWFYEDDPVDRPTFLVTGRHGAYAVCGWLLGAEGKLPTLWGPCIDNGGRESYWIPRKMLHLEYETGS